MSVNTTSSKKPTLTALLCAPEGLWLWLKKPDRSGWKQPVPLMSPLRT